MTDAQRAADTLDRKNVRKFFSFNVMKDEAELRKVNTTLVAFGGGIAAAIGVGLIGDAGLLLGIAGALGTYFLDRESARSELEKHEQELADNRAEFSRLAADVRKIQSRDLTKAVLRVFERTQLDRDKLRIFDNVYIFEDEQKLLEDETREQKIGDLLNKSIRMVSPGDYSNVAYRPVRWIETDTREDFFNPMRLVILFLTQTQVVICDVQIDSMDGDLREEIQRVSLNKIVNIRFVADRKRFPPRRQEIVRWAENLRCDKAQIDEIREASDQLLEEKWTIEELTSILSISRTDGGSLAMPIRSERYFGGSRGALDDDGALNADEIKVDRMINELNRLVETS